MSLQSRYERQRIILWERIGGANIGVYLVLRDGVPIRVEAPGFLVPPQRKLVIEAIQKAGWSLSLSEWVADEDSEDHPTLWLSEVTRHNRR